MEDLISFISTLKRPSLSVRAARFANADYKRKHSLRRLFPGEALTCQEDILPRLVEIEAQLEGLRKMGIAGYSPARHIEVLAAIMAEGSTAKT